MKAYFLSDIHIQEPESSRAQLFEAFLSSLLHEEFSDLFLLGDIFDLWIDEHSYFVRKYSRIISVLRELQQKGVKIHYFEGNHDLYLERFWQDEMGVAVYGGPATFRFDSLKVRVEHGDQMDPEDRGYRFLRWLLRTPALRWLAHHLPEFIVVAIGEKSSQKSRHYTTEVKTKTEEDIRQKIRLHAVRCLKKDRFDLLIAGHVHFREDFTIEYEGRTTRVINLGTWLKEPTAFIVTPERQYFVEWA